MSNFSNYWYLFLTKELVYQIRVKKTKYNSKMLDFNTNQSNDEYSINNNNDSSNSKTPVSKYDSNNNGSPSTTFNPFMHNVVKNP